MKRSLLAGLVLSLLSTTAAAQTGEGAPGPAGPGGGPTPDQLLNQADEYYKSLEYEAALRVLVAVQQMPDATANHKAFAFLYMGACFTAIGNAESAVASFMELLKLKPGFRVGAEVSPSIQALFKEALKRMKLPEQPAPEGGGEGQPAGQGGGQSGGSRPATEPGVSVEASLIGAVKAGQPVDIKIELTDPGRAVQEVVLHWRLVGGPDYSVIRVKYRAGQQSLTARIPAAMLGQGSGRLQFVVEVLGRGGLSLAHAGSHASPIESEIEAAPRARSRWGWYLLGIGGGAALVGGVVAAILLTRGTAAPPAPTAGTVSVTVH